MEIWWNWCDCTVNLNRPAAEALDRVADRKALTRTEAVRQAIGVWQWIDEAVQRGASIQIVEADGQTREVLPMP